ncbi:ATP-dependent protease Clp ATPase subunit [Azospirillum fermentarium]|uniref:ClpX C4-type zinc finger protein n=1 Tax=Azospirillum fermentarium TaxID=1233114 RepID=UPI0022277F6D|nr:ClpX C4-type zinc finger protein [Azospirillum fermentarium]MCW2247738.1 ATP-dependent protease Clp ATPase subunit [Azospirillum fermentarium]
MSDTPYADDAICSFCAKHRRDVDLLVTSAECRICDECIELCADIIGPERQAPDPPHTHPPAPDGGGERCSFCGRQHNEVHNLIAGPGCFICSFCVWNAHSILAQRREAWTALRPGASAKRSACSFCGKASTEVWRLMQKSQGHICDECVAACIDMLDRNLGKKPGTIED